MKRFSRFLLKAVGVLAALVALFVGSIMFFSRHERSLAHGFVAQLGKGQITEAHNLFSEGLKKEYPLATMRAQFELIEPYATLHIRNVSVSTNGTELGGTLKTATGCVSSVTFVFVDRKLTTFWVTEPCLVEERSA